MQFSNDVLGVQGIQVDDPLNAELRLQSWKVLEEFYERGVFKSIGVSNYNVRHLQELLSSCKIKPHVNQVILMWKIAILY